MRRTRLTAGIAAAATSVTLIVGLTAAVPAAATDSRDRGPRGAIAAATGPDTRSLPRLAPGERRTSTTRSDLDAAIEKVVADGAIGVVARVDSPALHWSDAAGVRERGTTRRARPDDRFRAASNTKMMVAVLVMQQIERGTWTLHTTIGEVAPGTLPGHDEVTVEQLLSHTSGAPDGLAEVIVPRMSDPTSWSSYMAAINSDYAPDDAIRGARSTPWLFTPGTGWSYSNAGYAVLRRMLERQTGTRVSRLLQRGVFRPAHMRHTTYAERPGTRGRFLEEQAHTPDGWSRLDGFDPELFNAAGAVVSTTRDLNRFSAALMAGRLVDRDLVDEMLRARATEPLAYGLGMMRLDDPCTPAGAPPQYLYGHNGGSFGTASWELSTPDGSRRMSIAATGRYYSDDPSAPSPFDLMEPLAAMARATCR